MSMRLARLIFFKDIDHLDFAHFTTQKPYIPPYRVGLQKVDILLPQSNETTSTYTQYPHPPPSKHQCPFKYNMARSLGVETRS
jgi:hypothetical protein